MFRILSFGFDDFMLGHVSSSDFNLVPDIEVKETEYPYSTVLIGENGTGKSTILSYISKVFQDLNEIKTNQSKFQRKVRFPYTIVYRLDNEIYVIHQKRQHTSFIYEALKVTLPKEETLKMVNEQVDWSKINIPSKVIAISHLPMDRFDKKVNEVDDFYIYLGMMDSNNTARPSAKMTKAARQIFQRIERDKNFDFVRSLLKFMKFDTDYLKLSTNYRYKSQFFSGNLTSEKFINLMEDWSQFTERKDTPFSISYYESVLKGKLTLINKLVQYMNTRVRQDNIVYGKNTPLEFNIFQNIELLEEWRLLEHLRRLDLIDNYTLTFRKSRDLFIDDTELSSGEFNYFSNVVSLAASIDKNSLVLIDEPETSFHPAWQMKYVNHLKEMLSEYNSSHFVIATHSHFIVSDLENKSSEIVKVSGQAPHIQVESLNYPTYGWSAEEVLFKVFRIKSTRNYFFEIRIKELLHHLSSKSEDIQRIKDLIRDLKIIECDKNDPLSIIINEAQTYVRDM
jgi:predicted ATP-binding protein involved in virulence